MDAIHQFWWNWWVQCAVAIGTFAAVIVALFVSINKPKPLLKVDILREGGEQTRLTSGEDARFYHLHVWNENRSTPATDVQVCVSRLEEIGPDGKTQDLWLGDLPLRWRDQEFVSPRQRMGTARDCDLCMIGKHSGLDLLPLFVPNSMNPHRQEKCRMVLTVQARSSQVDGELICIEISWDGIWGDDEGEMKKHFKIEIRERTT